MCTCVTCVRVLVAELSGVERRGYVQCEFEFYTIRTCAEEKTLAHLCLTHRDVLKALDQSMPSTGCPGWGDMTPQVGGFGSTQNIAQSMPHRRATSAAPSGVPTLSGGMAPTRRPSSGTVGGLTGSRSAQNCTSPSSQGDAAATLFREDGRTSFEQV